MKPSLLLLAFISAAAITGCSSAYRTGQTPDDLYYSAAKPDKEDDQDDQTREEDKRGYDEEYYSDRYLRMKVRDHRRWSDLDDWYYNDKFSASYSYYYGSYNNPYNSWNFYYNPYCCCHSNYYYNYYSFVKSPVAAPVLKRNFNLAGYTNTSYNNNGGSYKAPTIKTTRTYNNSNNNGGLIKTIFSKDNSSRSDRTYNPSSNSGSGKSGSGNSGSGSGGNSGGGSGGGSGPVTRPVRK